MKFKHEETITIPVPEQFQKAGGLLFTIGCNETTKTIRIALLKALSLISLTIAVLTVKA